MAKLTYQERRALEKDSGLNRIAAFIPQKDYTDDLIRHVAHNVQPNEDGTFSREYESMLEKSAAILSYLRNNGYEYSVQTTGRERQLEAKLSDRNMTIRLIDTDENAKYCGRCYVKGKAWRYEGSSVTNAETSIGFDDITPDDAVRLVQKAMGKSITVVESQGDAFVDTGRQVGNMSVDTASNRRVKNHDVYYSPQSNTQTYLAKVLPERTVSYKNRYGSIRSYSVKPDMNIKVKDARSRANIDFFSGENGPERAEMFVENSREQAIDNFIDRLELDAVALEAKYIVSGLTSEKPHYSDDKAVAERQMQYYKECVRIYGDTSLSDAEHETMRSAYNDEFRKQVGDIFGNTTLRQINPVMVASYMDASQSSLANERRLMTAMKRVASTGEAYEIIGDGFAENSFKDKMISYNPEPVIGANGVQYPRNLNPNSDEFDNLSDFWKNIGKTVHTSMLGQGVDEKSISINVDENGIIHYEGHKYAGAALKSEQTAYPVEGNIGQVFEPDMREYNDDGSLNLRKGLIETRFASGGNYYIAPGYTAYIVPPVDDYDNSSYIERTRVRSYTRSLCEKLEETLSDNLSTSMLSSDKAVAADEVSTLNDVYHHIYGTRYELDFESKFEEEGKTREDIRAIIDTNLGCVRYDSHYKDDASMLAQAKAQKNEDRPISERGFNEYTDNVKACMGVINPEVSEGYFDPIATGTGMNQGIVRYLTADAKIDESTGKIVKGEETYCPVMKLDYFRNADHSAVDRVVMGFMNYMHMSSVVDISTVYMDLGGETQDDTVFVYKDFADKASIRGADGEMRSLLQGDKVCQFHGNKGVIKIVDRNIDVSTLEPKEIPADATASERAAIEKANKDNERLRQIVDFGRNNPHVESVMSSMSAMSRFNIGMFHDAQENAQKAKAEGKSTSIMLDGKEIPGCVHYGPIVVTDMPVDEKTHLYDEEGGRKASGQLVACLAANGAYDVIKAMYKNNEQQYTKMREFLIPLGVDMSETGTLRVGYEPHMLGKDKEGNPIYEQRNELSIKDFVTDPDNQTAKGGLKISKLKDVFEDTLGENGGFLKLPFPVRMATGEYTPEVLDENGKGTGEYRLPVLAGKYRSARETVDNKLVVHEYTMNYNRICESAAKYVQAVNVIANGATGKTLEGAKKIVTDEQRAVQSEYTSMTSDINDKYFTGKHNLIKQEVLRSELDNTATLVVAGDPTCDLDEVKISATTAMALGINPDDEKVKRGDHKVLLWRDPCISDGAMRYMKATVVEDRPDAPGYDSNHPKVVGMLMNPSSAVSFEGDFDGDSFAVWNITDPAAIACAEEKLTMQVQMLNRSVGKDGEHPLYIQDGLDVAAGLYYDEQTGGNLKERLSEVTRKANEAEFIEDKEARRNAQNDIFKELNEINRSAHDSCMFKDVIRFEPTDEEVKNAGSYEQAAARVFFESYLPILESGAKGSPGKLKSMVAKYYGCDIECEQIDGKYAITKCEVVDEPLVTNEDRLGSSTATHAKANLTGVAGKFLQHGMMLALNSENQDAVTAVTALTGSVTQKVMQLKHQDAETVMKTVDVVGNTAGIIWAGKGLCKNADTGMWEEDKVSDPDNPKKMISKQLTPEEWKKTFTEFWTDENGLNCAPPNPKYVNAMANAMTAYDDKGKPYIQGFDHSMDTVKNSNIDPLIDMAYEPGGIDKIKRYAMEGASLYEGCQSVLTANKTLRRNIEEQRKSLEDPDYVPNYKGFAAKDTQISASASVEDVLQTGDIHEIAKYMKANPGDEIRFSKREIERAADDKENVVVDKRHYSELDEASRVATMESVAMKVYEYSEGNKKIKPEFTVAEHDFYSMVKEQNRLYTRLGTPDARNEYAANNPGAFQEMIAYQSFMNKTREEAAASKIDMDMSNKNSVEFRDRPIEEQTAIAKSLYEKLVSHDALQNGSPEHKLYLMTHTQSAELDAVPRDKQDEYMVANKDRLYERILCTKIKCEAQGTPYDKLPQVIKDDIVDSYVRKTMSYDRANMSKYEIELESLVERENEELKKKGGLTTDERDEYLKNNAEDFPHRMACTEKRRQIERENAQLETNSSESKNTLLPKDVALNVVSKGSGKIDEMSENNKTHDTGDMGDE